jgi:hypothetical protein
MDVRAGAVLEGISPQPIIKYETWASDFACVLDFIVEIVI